MSGLDGGKTCATIPLLHAYEKGENFLQLSFRACLRCCTSIPKHYMLSDSMGNEMRWNPSCLFGDVVHTKQYLSFSTQFMFYTRGIKFFAVN